jgi:hypothetical protein
MRDHPTVQRFHEMQAQRTHLPDNPRVLDADWLRQLCLDCGADDVGFVELDRPALADQRAEIVQLYPYVRSLISFVCRMNRGPVRSPARSVANVEFHSTGDEVNDTARNIVTALEREGSRP